MTVIDAFLDRPKVVPKQKISFGNKKRKSSSENRLMPEVQGCNVGDVLDGEPNVCSMDANRNLPDADIDAQFIQEKAETTDSSLQYKKQRILIKSNRSPVRSRRKSRWKLKFHHQALPPEYLRHYKQQERKRRQSESTRSGHHHLKQKSRKVVKRSGGVKGSSDKVEKSGESDSGAFKMDDAARETSERLNDVEVVVSCPAGEKRSNSPPPPQQPPQQQEQGRRRGTEEGKTSVIGIPQLDIDVTQNKAFLENLLTNQIEINRVEEKSKKTGEVKQPVGQLSRVRSAKQEERQKPFPIPPSGKIMNYSDLPYMGEITLDGIKPRRGRKPKKADICHLIYKNYGQVFPGAPGRSWEGEEKKQKWRPETNDSSQGTKGRPGGNSCDARLDSPLPTVSGLIDHTEVQNRIINSLLEKRLTQGLKSLKGTGARGREERRVAESYEEPLNLCVRDLQSLKIKLSRKHGNFYETKQKDADEMKIKSEAEDGIKMEVIDIERSDSEMESTDENEEDDLAPFNLVTTELRESSDEDTYLNFNDQITLTRVKIPPKKEDPREGNFCEKPELPQEPNQVLFWSGGFVPGVAPTFAAYPKPRDASGGTKAEAQERRCKSKGERPQMKRVASNANGAKAAHVITKRKRSAIFIPPVPAESTTNPTTEVSICKFKFTGGARPSLQEKKMLSVDSGGNFRYYSGTGDKSMRGYEYFPRESLQQCQENTGCSPSGVFLTASALGSGEKIPEEIGHSGFFDADFPLQVSKNEPRQRSKGKMKKAEQEKRLPEVSCYQSLREHLLGTSKSEPSTVSLLQEEDDGNLSDESGEGFDFRNVGHGYLDGFKVQEETSRMSSRSDETSSRNRKLRKSRKSLAREKLEQTFKEKGFLIQTQQLESAEGATYCKFRQLRKFTRYLFRSWKDYLPGNVRNLSVDAGVENPEMFLGVPEAAGIKMEPLEADGGEKFKAL